jgi:catechol 2,3-dioxygenase-like lactoylglutathione lyase family enzyme
MTRAPSLFRKIDHVELVTEQPDRSFEFYTKVIGFRETLRQSVQLPGNGGTLNIVYMDLGGTAVELMSYEGAQVKAAPQKPHRGYQLMALEVGDMKQTLAELKTQGVEASWGPVDVERYVRAEILDPDGNSIELREWKQGRPA